jgi:hypothetical protein
MKSTFYLGCLLLFSLSLKAQTFSDVAQSKGILHTYGLAAQGGGVSFADFDMDGRDDLTFASATGTNIAFYRNTGGSFQRLNLMMPNLPDNMKQVIWVDVDNDGDQDFFVSADYDDNYLYYNDGNLNFQSYLLPAPNGNLNGPSYASTFGDIDRDGDLDLFICNRSDPSSGSMPNQLFQNNGDGTFSDITSSYFFDTLYHLSLATTFWDYNSDLEPDLYVADDKFDPNQLYLNTGGGNFVDAGPGSNADIVIEAMSATVGDYDNDGDLDMYVSNTPFNGGNYFLRNENNGTFTEIGDTIGVRYNGYGWGSNFLDYDNDGYLDIYAAGANYPNRYANRFFINQQNGFYQTAWNLGFANDSTYSYGTAVGDYNEDGFPDIAVLNMMPDQQMLWENSGGTKNWLKIRLEGTLTNRDAIGSWVLVYANGQQYSRHLHAGEGYLGQHSKTQIFGLDTATTVDSILIRWLSGGEERFYNIEANQTLSIIEGAGFCQAGEPLADSLVYCFGDTVDLFTDGSENTAAIWQYGWRFTDSLGNMQNVLFGPSGLSAPLNDLLLGLNADSLQAGRYLVQALAFDAQGNVCDLSEDTSLLVVGPGFSFSGQVQDVTSFGGNNGAIQLNVQGDTNHLSFNWSNGAISQNLEDLLAGTYTVNIVDAWGCSLQDSFEVHEPPLSTEDMAEMKFRLYPNPVEDLLYIDWVGAEAELKIYNLQGQLLLQQVLDVETDIIQLNQLSIDQLFVIHITIDGKQSIQRIHIKK